MPPTPRPESDDDQELQREVLEHRKFSIAEAIGRLGGGDLMKGASPVSPRRQAELIVEAHLERSLRDTEGALETVLLREFTASQQLLEAGYDDPLPVLKAYCQRLLAAPVWLDDLVRQADAEWGRVYLERPRFNLPGRPAAPNDPYTPESVRERLERLIASLPDGPA